MLMTYKEEILAIQKWLCLLNKACARDNWYKPHVERNQPAIADAISLTPKQLFPRWLWGAQASDFPWKANVDTSLDFKSKRSLSRENFRLFLEFCNSISWKQDDALSTSLYEIAILAHHLKFRFQLAGSRGCGDPSFLCGYSSKCTCPLQKQRGCGGSIFS